MLSLILYQCASQITKNHTTEKFSSILVKLFITKEKSNPKNFMMFQLTRGQVLFSPYKKS